MARLARLELAFLCSNDGKWLTGQRFEVTGGFNL
jgi:hypothetical protein